MPESFDLDLAVLANNIDQELIKLTNEPNIHEIRIEYLKNFYGYNCPKQYLKIIYSNPYNNKILINIFEQGLIGPKTTVFESHIPYLLQFLIQYDLYGLGEIEFKKALHRSNKQLKDSSILDKESYLDEYDCDIADISYSNVQKGLGYMLTEEQTRISVNYSELLNTPRICAYNPDERLEYLKQILEDENTKCNEATILHTFIENQLSDSSLENDKILLSTVSDLEKSLTFIPHSSHPVLPIQPRPTNYDCIAKFNNHNVGSFDILSNSSTFLVFPPSRSQALDSSIIYDLHPEYHSTPFFSKFNDWVSSSNNMLLLPHRIQAHKETYKQSLWKYSFQTNKRIVQNNRLLLVCTDPPSIKSLGNKTVDYNPKWKYNYLTTFNNNRKTLAKNTMNLTNMSVNSIMSFSCENENTIYDDLNIKLMCMELFALSTTSMPTPQNSTISAIFYTLRPCPSNISYFLLACTPKNTYKNKNVKINYFDTELCLLQKFIKIVQNSDCDILLSYDSSNSWLFFIQRAVNLGLKNVSNALSRVPFSQTTFFYTLARYENKNSKQVFSWLKDYSQPEIAGRVIINLWKEIRRHMPLRVFTFEESCKKILKRKFPSFDYEYLKTLWSEPVSSHRIIHFLNYFTIKLDSCVKIFEQIDLLGNTYETCLLTGLPISAVLTRGSQIHVESLFLRLTKHQNYIVPTPSQLDKEKMRAFEYLPLTLEPSFAFNPDPVVVLDYQSLYPSIMIAYNLCYSTCLCRLDDINSSSSKLGCRILSRLTSRQLSIKLIANVVYGYTSAGFTGHMPFSDLADSIVSTGRKILEDTIKSIENTSEWKASVYFMLTFCVFVLLRGVSREKAFKIGREIAEKITNSLPQPIKLKFEKVYHPCFLQTKKRYAGYSWDNEYQTTPNFDSKGIETIRRDFCPFASKALKKCLKVLFDTKDISKVKEKFQKICHNLNHGNIKLNDLYLTKIYKGFNNYKQIKNPITEIIKKSHRENPNIEPNVGDRIAYVIVAGPDQAILASLVETVDIFLGNKDLCPNNVYYITKQLIPPLHRFLSLLDVDINQWYREISSSSSIWDKICPQFGKSKSQKTLTQFFFDFRKFNVKFLKNTSHHYKLIKDNSLIRKLCHTCCESYLRISDIYPPYLS
ncbi:hypothetical protein HZS_5051, partial [Henneguya salminicola]